MNSKSVSSLLLFTTVTFSLLAVLLFVNVKQVIAAADGITWTEATASAEWPGREHFSALVYDNKMWVMGGYHDYKNDVWYSTDGITWTEATASAGWSPRSGHEALVYDNKMWVMGGQSEYCLEPIQQQEQGYDCNDVWYSTDGITWTEATASAEWPGREHFSALVYDNKMWVMGGYHDYKNDVWYSTDGITWTEATASAEWVARSGHEALVYDNKMWVMGGSSEFCPESIQDQDYDCNDVWYTPIMNTAPVLSPIGNQTINEGSTLTFTLDAYDTDGDNLTYSASNLPSGSTFDSQTGTFIWNTGYTDAGNYPDVEFTVTDDGTPMELDVELITITVGNVNREPVLTNPGSQVVLETELLMFTVSATDPDGDSLILNASNTPAGATFDPQTGSFAWTPTTSQEGFYIVTFTATDDGTPTETGSIDVVITVGNNPTPTEQAEDLVEVVITIDLPQNVENSYLANLKKVKLFIEEGKVSAAINQLNAFINKLDQDYIGQKIENPYYTNLRNAGLNLIDDISN